jgi:GNAT superfamily N-acetyltransferase
MLYSFLVTLFRRRGQRWDLTGFAIRKAAPIDAPRVNLLLSEWFDWTPKSGRLQSVRRAVINGEIGVAEVDSEIAGFIHYVMHEDIIDGGPNVFISALYVSTAYRRKGVGSQLLEHAISDSLARGAVGVETSTTRLNAKRLYQRHHFRQAFGDIYEAFLELDIEEYLRTRKSLRP